jgi:nitrogen fixation protein FixH
MNRPLSRPLTGRLVIGTFIAGFLIVIAANGIMAYFAVSTFTGVTTAEPYTRGLRYNRELAAADAQAALGWKVEAEFRAHGERRGELIVTVADRAGAPVAAEGEVQFVRPVERGMDFAAALSERERGRLSAGIEFPRAGQWEARIALRRGDAVHRRIVRVRVQ